MKKPTLPFRQFGCLFRAKSEFQKEDCVYEGCLNKSTLEAVRGMASIRCCGKHKRFASWIASEQITPPKKKTNTRKLKLDVDKANRLSDLIDELSRDSQFEPMRRIVLMFERCPLRDGVLARLKNRLDDMEDFKASVREMPKTIFSNHLNR